MQRLRRLLPKPHSAGPPRPRGRALRRRGLAPLELVLALPLLMMVLAVIVNIGIEVKWKIRALAVSRQVVWRQRSFRNGAGDPRPAGWPENATLAAAPAPPPSLFPQDPFAAHAATRGPILRDPDVSDPDSQLLVDTQMLDLASDLEQGRATISRSFPFLPKYSGVRLDVEHLLLDSQWRFQELGYGNNESRRARTLYKFVAPSEVQDLAEVYREAAVALTEFPLQDALRTLDQDDEFRAWYGSAQDFHPLLGQTCALDRFGVRAGVAQELIDAIQGPNGGGLGGVPAAISNAFIQMYEEQIAGLQAQTPPPASEISALQDKINQLKQFLGSLN